MKSIILYYSRAGKAEKLAKKLQKALGSEILKVEPEKAYGNYVSSIIRVIRENSKGIAPAFNTEIPNLDSYDVVVIGYPIWASDIPAFFAAFLQKCNLSKKIVVPFATFGGTKIDNSLKTLKQVCPESNIALPYNYGIFNKDNFEKWVESIQQL